MNASRSTVADVVVVGGGAVGLCAAAALAARGVRVTLVERGLPGGANSTLTGGGIRQQFGTEANIRLSRLSAPFWDRFEERCGTDPLFRPIGYLFLAGCEQDAAGLRAQVALQNGLGVTSEYLDGDAVARRWPALAGRGFVAGGFRQGDGWANQQRIVFGLTGMALAEGVAVQTGTECLALHTRGSRVTGVATTAGTIGADAVLLATGPWGQQLLEPLGIRFAVAGHRHQLLLVEPSTPLPPGLPWLIGIRDQVHLRSDAAGRALVGGFLGHDESSDPDHCSRRPDPDWTRAVLVAAGRVFGVVDDRATVRHGWAGLYPVTPDRHPIIDRLAEGLYAAVGFSGTGLMHAPAAGLLVGELIVDGAMLSADPAPFRCDRFSDGRLDAEPTGF